MREVIVDGEETVRPLTAVITSPAVRPAESAGPPATVPAIRPPAGAAPPKPPLPIALAISTPRNAVGPMWTAAVALPDSILLASARAVLIGIAYESLAPADRNAKLVEAAVSIPIT